MKKNIKNKEKRRQEKRGEEKRRTRCTIMWVGVTKNWNEEETKLKEQGERWRNKKNIQKELV